MGQRSQQQQAQQAPGGASAQQPPARRAGAHVIPPSRGRVSYPPDLVTPRAHVNPSRNAQRGQQAHRAEASGGKGRKTSASTPTSNNQRKTSQDVSGNPGNQTRSGASGSQSNQHRPNQNEPSTSQQANARRVNHNEAAAAERHRPTAHSNSNSNNESDGNTTGASASNSPSASVSPSAKKSSRSQLNKSTANTRAPSVEAGGNRQQTGSASAAGRPNNLGGRSVHPAGRTTSPAGRSTSPGIRATSPASAGSRSIGSSGSVQSPGSSSSGAQSPISSTSIPSSSRSVSSGNSTPSATHSVGASSSNSSSAQSGSQPASGSSSAPSVSSQSIGGSSSNSHQSTSRTRTSAAVSNNSSRTAENHASPASSTPGSHGSSALPSTSTGRSQSNPPPSKTNVPSSRPSAPAPQQHLIDVRSQLENTRSNQPRFQPRVQRQTQTTQTPPQMDTRNADRSVNVNSVNIEMDSDNHLVTSNLPPGVSGGRPEVNEALPDILNSHVLPPYTAGRQNQHRAMRQNQHRNRTRRRPPPGTTNLNDDRNRSCCQCNRYCCIRCVTHITSFRWVLVSLAMLGVCCVVTGIILGALHMTVGSSFLTLSLMFIGLGVMLVVVVGLGWKCTPAGHEPCHLLFHLGDHAPDETELPPVVNNNVSSGRQRPSRDRNHWFGGVLYSEFRFRRPPPSYNASMQEYQQQLMAAQLHPPPPPAPPAENYDNYSLPSSPPPTYKSRASTIRTGLHITFPPTEGGEYPHSRPPTYRSHADVEPRPTIPMDNNTVTAPTDMASGDDTSPGSPEETLPGSAGSTLHRVTRVVQYLEGVLEGQSGMSDSEESRGARSRSSSAATDSEALARNQSDGTTSDTSVPERVADTHL